MHSQVVDEDVELMGSPLKEYLDNLNTSHDECYMGSSESTEPHIISTGRPYENTNVDTTTSLTHEKMMKETNFLHQVINFLNIKLKSKELNKQLNQRFAHMILQNKLLLQSDLEWVVENNIELIQEFEDDEVKLSDMEKNGVKIKWPAIIAALSIVLMLPLFSQFWINSSLCLATITIVYVLIFLAMNAASNRRNSKILLSLDNFLISCQDLQNLIDKSVRLVQEMEIAAMGYTLTSGKTPISRLERSKEKAERECLQLRYTMLSHAISFIFQCREMTLHLIQSKAGTRDGGNQRFYICKIPLTDLGPCFVDNPTFESLSVCTDNFCLDVLRDIVKFMKQQCSELMKCLVTSAMDASFPSDFVSNICPELNELQTSVQESIVSVRLSYKVHLNPTKRIVSERHTESTAPLRHPPSVPLHSLSVHLRSALNISLKAEEELENRREYAESEAIQENCLQQIKVHIVAAGLCWDDCIKKLNSKHETKSMTSPPAPAQMLSDLEKSDAIVDASLLDPNEAFTEDEIFEGVPEATVEEIDDAVERNEDDNLESHRKSMMQETSHVMKELKSVLHVKTSEEEREIRKSKLFPDYKPKIKKLDRNIEEGNREVAAESDKVVTDAKAMLAGGITSDSYCFDEKGNGTDDFDPCVSDKSLETSFQCGDLSSKTFKILKVPKRPLAPARLKRKPMAKLAKTTELRNLKSDICENDLPPADDDASSEESKVGLGFGFSSLLAKQAANLALSNRNSSGSSLLLNVFENSVAETTFGVASDSEQFS